MKEVATSATILIAENDAEDQMLLKDAFAENRLAHNLQFVDDGEEMMDYLRGHGQYADCVRAPRPSLIVLDLNMPRKDGREALQEIKTDPLLRRIPVIVLTTSQSEADITRSYDLGVNSFITKPTTFTALVEVVKIISAYWLEMVELPIA
ncbi:MAG: response regulator [Candidatus Binatia bacterium]